MLKKLDSSRLQPFVRKMQHGIEKSSCRSFINKTFCPKSVVLNPKVESLDTVVFLLLSASLLMQQYLVCPEAIMTAIWKMPLRKNQ